MDRLLRLIDALCAGAEHLAIALLYGIAALMLAEVGARAMGRSIPFSWEYCAYGMAAAFFLGMGAALRHGAHIRVLFLRDALPARPARLLDIAASCAGLALSAVIVVAQARLTGKSIARGLVSNTVMQTPLAIPQAVVLAGAALLALAFVARLLRQLTGRPAETDGGRAAGH
ncbi:TRAP transporter, DctQ-like membrane protein [Bordetella bronchiseptica E014]|uniref:TRAP transporter small permease subunit n=1 Tax=Bordetella bronchiseptica TaxID=518 RepID=UPI0004A09A1B|nr:TRAP transporter small permease [Bordetella bronchiseptica]KDC13299.1 TRAP transporter, DctQ-like membrane protein [Bordetella bronchiseptica E014]